MGAILDSESGLFVFPSKVDGEFCRKVTTLAGGYWNKAEVEDSESSEKTTVDSVLRRSEVYWTEDQWIVDYIWPFMTVGNEMTGLNYDIKRVETIQLTRYKVGDHYNFHVDSYSSHGYKNKYGLVRKLSMTIQLNDDYEGGEFEVCKSIKGRSRKEVLEKSKGTVIVFPSCLEHRVKKVTSGERYSLVAWFLGPPLR